LNADTVANVVLLVRRHRQRAAEHARILQRVRSYCVPLVALRNKADAVGEDQISSVRRIPAARTRVLVGGCELRLLTDQTAHIPWWVFPLYRR
jgi:hypothetical protein